MLGSNPGQLRLRQCLADARTTRLDLIQLLFSWNGHAYYREYQQLIRLNLNQTPSIAPYYKFHVLYGRYYKCTLNRCCGSGMFIPDPGLIFSIPDPGSRVKKIPDPGSESKNISTGTIKLTKKTVCKLSEILYVMFIPEADGSPIWILIFHPSRIPDPRPGSATLL